MSSPSALKTREDILETVRAATKSYVSTGVTIEINDAWCKGCGICVEFCPKDVLKMTHLDKVDVQAIVERVDVDAIVNNIDIDSLVRQTELGSIIARSTTGVATEVLDVVRAQGVGLDDFFARWTNRLLRRPPDSLPEGPALLVAPTTPALTSGQPPVAGGTNSKGSS